MSETADLAESMAAVGAAFNNLSVRLQEVQATFSGGEAWVTDQAYNKESRQWVEHGGSFYLCAASHISGVFAEDLAEDRWVQIDTLNLIGQLASGGGSALIGFRQAGIDAALRNLQLKVREIQINPMDYEGCVGDGIADDSEQIRKADAAAKAAGGDVVFTNKHFCSSKITRESGVSWIGTPGASLRFDVPDIAVELPSGATGIGMTGLKIFGVASRMVGSPAGGSPLSRLMILDNDISGATLEGSGYSAGLFIDGLTDSWIGRNTLHGNGRGACTGADNCDIMLYQTSPTARVRVFDNNCVSTMVSYNIATYCILGTSITGNFCSGALCGANNNNGYGILAYDAFGAIAARNIIAFNIVCNTQGTAVYAASCKYMDLVSNLCVDVALTQTDITLAVGGIAFNSCAGVNANNNIVIASGKDGICSSNNGIVNIGGNLALDCLGKGYHLRGTMAKSTNMTGNVGVGCADNFHGDITPKSGLVFAGNSSVDARQGNAGIYFANLSKSTISVSLSTGSHGPGFAISGGKDNSILSNVFMDNSQGSENTADGAKIECDTSSVIGNRCGNSGPSGQRYGILNTGNGNTYIGNPCMNNQTDGFLDVCSSQNTVRVGNRNTDDIQHGSATLVGGTIFISTAEARAGDVVTLTFTGATSNPGHLSYVITPGSGVTVTSSNPLDASTVVWNLVH